MIVWVLFFLMIGIFLALDLGVFNRNPHVITYREASRWTMVWASLGILFSGVIYMIYQKGWIPLHHGSNPFDASIEYLTGYIIELTLSVDNIFVIAMIFKSFHIPLKYQHRVLFWGIIGALVFRALTILFGVVLIESFSWTTYLFGIFLIITAFRMLKSEDNSGFDPKTSWVYRTLRKIIPVTSKMEGNRFFIKKQGLMIATPLFLALILIEFTDVLFALDSIPAILGITRDPFIVFTSNIFAILGLRSMYFFIANLLDSFHYLKYSLTVILVFVGIKLILSNHFHVSILVSLSVIILSLMFGIYFSIQYKRKHMVASLPDKNKTSEIQDEH